MHVNLVSNAAFQREFLPTHAYIHSKSPQATDKHDLQPHEVTFHGVVKVTLQLFLSIVFYSLVLHCISVQVIKS